MALESDLILDRSRLKRRLTFWRVTAVLAAALLIIFTIGRFSGYGGKDHIAALDIQNIIVDDAERNEVLAEIAEDDQVKAVLVRINSPGGTVVGGESLFISLRRIAEKKPVVAVMGELATSAGYMAAVAADYIIGRQSTITGSIGVIMQTTDITGLLGKIGIKPEAIKSAPLKAQPNPLEPMSSAARQAAQDVISDMYDMFVTMVSERRNMDKATAKRLADGRVYTGRQAVKNGLIDALGGEKEALAWLNKNKGITESIPVKALKIRQADGILQRIGDELFGKTLFSKRLTLDGVISLWHPDVK